MQSTTGVLFIFCERGMRKSYRELSQSQGTMLPHERHNTDPKPLIGYGQHRKELDHMKNRAMHLHCSGIYTRIAMAWQSLLGLLQTRDGKSQSHIVLSTALGEIFFYCVWAKCIGYKEGFYFTLYYSRKGVLQSTRWQCATKDCLQGALQTSQHLHHS